MAATILLSGSRFSPAKQPAKIDGRQPGASNPPRRSRHRESPMRILLILGGLRNGYGIDPDKTISPRSISFFIGGKLAMEHVRTETDMSMAEYLESCRGDPMRYANAAERLLAAIGEPQMIDTAKDARLGRIFLNRTMRAYPAFAGFYGMEETIERIVGFFRHAAQGLEERKQILYLLGPVGGGKSSLAERLK